LRVSTRTTSIHFLIIIGAIVLVIGLVLAGLGTMGRVVDGRRP
jgi:hypothetical protein